MVLLTISQNCTRKFLTAVIWTNVIVSLLYNIEALNMAASFAFSEGKNLFADKKITEIWFYWPNNQAPLVLVITLCQKTTDY